MRFLSFFTYAYQSILIGGYDFTKERAQILDLVRQNETKKLSSRLLSLNLAQRKKILNGLGKSQESHQYFSYPPSVISECVSADMLKILIKAGANIDINHKGYHSAAHLALKLGDLDKFDMLLSCGLKPKNTSLLEELLSLYVRRFKNAAQTPQNKDISTPISAERLIQSLEQLAASGLDIKQPLLTSAAIARTALTYLSSLPDKPSSTKEIEGAKALCVYLIKKGCDINAKIPNKNWTLFSMAAMCKSVWLIEFLVEHYQSNSQQLLKFKEQLSTQELVPNTIGVNEKLWANALIDKALLHSQLPDKKNKRKIKI